jgi:E3 ubiquitin-protein ligase RFWD2
LVMCASRITKCGHTYCHQCILKSIEKSKNCPKCNCALLSADNIFPNIVLNELVTKHKHRLGIARSLEGGGGGGVNGSASDADTLKNFLASETKKLTLPDVNVILEVLHQRKLLLEAESCAAQNRLLHEFLRHLHFQKQQQMQQIDKEMKLIVRDIGDVEKILKDVHRRCPTAAEVENSTVGRDDAEVRALKDEMLESIAMIESSVPSAAGSNTTTVAEEGFNLNSNYGLASTSAMSTFMTRKQRMYAHFDDFIQCYFSARSSDLYFGKEEEKAPENGDGDMAVDKEPDQEPPKNNGLEVFRECLTKFSKYSALRPLATLNYSNDLSFASTIVSSIEFNKDAEFFAIAGVTKRIKIFDYYAAIRDAVVDIKYPVNEMVCSSKISCVIWNCYFKDVLASSDYEGIVQIWDVDRGVRTKVFQEHDKRCWSVDFNEIDTKLLASGSDDGRVKLWSLSCDHSVHTLEAKANVCCVKFNPRSSCHLAFGSADHCVHYYDLRNMKEALCVFKGHKKAVSYVKFLNTEEIVSAGTDGTLKLWNVNSPPYCHRSFTGHTNEKNFVGLATNGDYLTCGSEDNSLCVYYKGLSQQLFNLSFDLKAGAPSRNSLIEIERGADANDFVSAVCWRKDSDVVIAGNSRGIIKILELV